MADAFVLGFFGESETPTANAHALLRDLVDANLRNLKGWPVRFVVPVEPLTETLEGIADFCLSSQWLLDLVGHSDSFDERVDRYRESADLIVVPDDKSLDAALIDEISHYTEPRLILLANANNGGEYLSDAEYLVLSAAKGKNIAVKVFSLPNGLEYVQFENNQEEPDQMSRQREEEEPEDEEYEDDEVEDEDLEDDEEEEEEEEEDEPAPPRRRRVEPEPEDDDEPEDEGDEDEEEEEEEEEPEPPRRTVRMKKAPVKKAPAKARTASATESVRPKRLTETSLTRFFENDRAGFYELAAEYGLQGGKGVKSTTLIKKIIEAESGEAPPAPAVKKAPVKRAAAPAKTPRVHTTSLEDSNTTTVIKGVLVALAKAFEEAAAEL